ncbi:DUF5447 family protein [Pseudomonas citronellolis]|nr:DUF5447 family protein [Pseudomonas citronellolis]WRT83934.1 DUF5447 family protein [Pseudomonas citronellolis]
MIPLKRYLHQPHAPDCDCSVCWSRRELAKPAASQSTPCTECRPTRVFAVVTTMALVAGAWRSIHSTYRVEPGFMRLSPLAQLSNQEGT